MKRFLCVLLLISVAVTSCGTPVGGSSTPPLGDNLPPQKTGVTSDSPIKEATVMPPTGGTSTSTIELVPVPHPEPPAKAEEKFGMIVNGFMSYAGNNRGRITSDQSVKDLWIEYTGWSLQIGASKFRISDILASFTEEDWNSIRELERQMRDPNSGVWESAALAAIIRVGSCVADCDEVFDAMWWACSHFASGEDWFTIPEGMMTNHPEPVVCGRKMDYERLLDLLDARCPLISVQYRGSTVRVTRKNGDTRGGYRSYAYALSTGEVAVITVAATVVVVGIIVIASGGTGSWVIVPVLLVAS